MAPAGHDNEATNSSINLKEWTMPEQVAITGAGGSLGMALAGRLLARGIVVKGLVRNEAAGRALERLGGVAVLGDVRQPASLAPLVQGCSVVFHLAAWMSGSGIGGRKMAEAVNVAGSANVVRLAAEMGCRRVVHASSVAVYGPPTTSLISEATPTRLVGDTYSDTKLEGERIAAETARRGGIELTILRPTMIYGPGSGTWTLTPLAAIARGLPIVLGDGEGLLDAVYIDDVAQAFDLAGFKPEAAGEIFIIGGETATWNDFMGGYARMLGARLRRLPVAVARLGLTLAAGASKIQPGSAATVPEMVGVLTSRTIFSSDKARQVLGYRPQVSLSDGMARTRAWLRQEGKLRFPATALVVGANGGLGRAVVQGLAAHGVEVWAADLSLPDQGWLPSGAHPVAIDVTSDGSVASAVETVIQQAGAIDLLVNIAGILKAAPLESQSLSAVQLQMEVNALGPLRLMRAVAPAMRQRRQGRIINIGSTNCYAVTPFFGAYSASKHALKAFSEALRMELGLWGVEVVVIHPAAMNTPFADRARQLLRREIEDQGGDWGSLLETFLKSWLWGSGSAQSPEQAAQSVIRVALARRRGSAEVYANRDAFLVRVFSYMPAFFRQRVLLSDFSSRRSEAPKAAPAADRPLPRAQTL
jgi:nucleoside-diphosphate-sugar epimerase